MIAESPTYDIQSPYSLSDEQLDFYHQHSYIKLKDVLSPEILAHYEEEITKKVFELSRESLPLEERATYQKAFLQVSNIWRHSELVYELVSSPRLARIATELMKVDGVRLYHDQALYKESNGGITPWHADQRYWPIEGERTVTAWIPLQAVSDEMGPLAFSPGSHTVGQGCEMEISDDSEKEIESFLEEKGFGLDSTPYDLGEISFHSGWHYHRAGENKSDHVRKVMTVIYMDKDTVRTDKKYGDEDAWCPGVAIDEPMQSALNPVLWER